MKAVERLWSDLSVPNRVDICKALGLPGRTGSADWRNIPRDSRALLMECLETTDDGKIIVQPDREAREKRRAIERLEQDLEGQDHRRGRARPLEKWTREQAKEAAERAWPEHLASKRAQTDASETSIKSKLKRVGDKRIMDPVVKRRPLKRVGER